MIRKYFGVVGVLFVVIGFVGCGGGSSPGAGPSPVPDGPKFVTISNNSYQRQSIDNDAAKMVDVHRQVWNMSTNQKVSDTILRVNPSDVRNFVVPPLEGLQVGVKYQIYYSDPARLRKDKDGNWIDDSGIVLQNSLTGGIKLRGTPYGNGNGAEVGYFIPNANATVTDAVP